MSRIQGRVTAVDPEKKSALVESDSQVYEIDYDFLVVASGLRRTSPSAPSAKTKKEFLIETEEHIFQLRNSSGNVVVIGGGKRNTKFSILPI